MTNRNVPELNLQVLQHYHFYENGEIEGFVRKGRYRYERLVIITHERAKDLSLEDLETEIIRQLKLAGINPAE